MRTRRNGLSVTRLGGNLLTMTTPKTLDELKAITDPLHRAAGAVAYIDRLSRFRADAISIRDHALRETTAGPTEAARIAGVSISTVKLARRAR